MEDLPPADPDWSMLPADTLATVLGELEFPDLFSSAAVCTSWRAIVRSLRRLGIYSRPQPPCLLYLPADGGGAGGAAEIYSLADKRTYTAPLLDPPLGELSIVGSSHGWLVTADARSELHLLNPATGDQLALPSVTTLEQVTPIFNDAGELQLYELSFYDGDLPRKEGREPGIYPLDELRDVLNMKAVLSGDPSRGGGGDCFVFLIYHPYRQLAFARVGGKQWHWITTSSYYRSAYSDIAYRDGAFYAMNRKGGIHRYDIEGSCATRKIVFNNILRCTAFHMYMAWTTSGDVLQIWRHTDDPDEDEGPKEMHTTSLEIYKADFEKQDVVPVNNLGDDALFIGHNCTLCICTKGYPTLLPNHVYFTDDDDWVMMSKGDRRDVGVYNLDNNSAEEIVSPQPWLNWPTPVWITPSFTKIRK